MSSGYVRQEDVTRSESPSLLPPPRGQSQSQRHQHGHRQQIQGRESDNQTAPTCYQRKQGCNRAFIWSWCCFTCSSILFVLLLLIPTLISIVMQEQICDQLCIPVPPDNWVEDINNPNDWKMNNWLTNSNRSQWPVEYFYVYLYNITNSDEVVAGTEPKLKVNKVGPYVFQVYRRKYNVSYADGNEQVFYEDLESHMFLPDKSAGALTDVLITIDMILVSTNWMIYTLTLEHYPMLKAPFDTMCKTNNNNCLFQKTLTVEQILFGYSNDILGFSRASHATFIPEFNLFFNYSTNIDEAHEMHLNNSYGMGGEAEMIPTTMGFDVFQPPASNATLLHGQYTGQGDSFGQIMSFFQVLGNTSVNVWNSPVAVRGTDHFQFAPPVTPESILTIWDPDVLRTVDLQFQEKVSVLGKYDAYRFIPTDDLFSGTNPQFFGEPGFEGLLFASPVSWVHYNAPVPGYASRPYLAGVTNSTLANSVECINCPDMSDPADWLNNYMDVEPNTGKVIGGKKRGQINVLIGQQEIYNNTQSPYGSIAYANVSLSLVPVVYFEYVSQIEQGDQTNQLDDGLDQIHLATTATFIAFYVLSSVIALCYLAAFRIGLKADEHGACFDRSAYSPLRQPLL